MSDKSGDGNEKASAKEAKNLAKEGLDAINQGDKDEGKFLIDAAKDLDKGAASAVLKGKTDRGDGQ